MLFLLVVPVIKEKPRVIKIVKKRTVVIECVVQSNFEPKCTWFKETTAIKESQRHVVAIQKTKDGEYAVKLEISQVSETDRGSYKLIAKNERGEASSQTVELTEITKEDEKGVAPSIIKKLFDQSIEEGQSIDMFVTLKQADKKVRTSWYKDTSIVKESREITMTFDGTTARLNISKTKVEHSATYRVVLTNDYGQDESSAKLIIKKSDEEKEEEEQEDVVEKIKKSEEEKKKEEKQKQIEEEKKKDEIKRVEEEKKKEEEIRKVEEKKKKEEERKKKEEKREEEKRKVEEVKQKDEARKKSEEKVELKKGPFDVMLKPAKQNKYNEVCMMFFFVQKI